MTKLERQQWQVTFTCEPQGPESGGPIWSGVETLVTSVIPPFPEKKAAYVEKVLWKSFS